MPYSINSSCIQCDNCLPACPTGAIVRIDEHKLWIDPNLCNNCEGYYPEPQCVLVCPVNSTIPFKAKKGRCKTSERTATSPDLFSNGKSSPFASAIVIWEMCNILSQRGSLPWKRTDNEQLVYERKVHQGESQISFELVESSPVESSSNLSSSLNSNFLQTLDIRSACLNLIYAAYAASLDEPWQQEFVINDQQIEEYLGLDKRKDLTKTAKLSLIKEIAQQPCNVLVDLSWSRQGKVKEFCLEKSHLWHLLEIQHHFQEDEQGCQYLVGLTFRIKAGLWSYYFLNKVGYKNQTAFYQYGTLPKSLLTTVMSIWQQHEGAARIILWLLFKSKMGREQRITISTLMRVAYGEQKLMQASAKRETRKRFIRTFESDLEVLNHYGIKPIFDPITYSPDIQPLWAKLADLPDDAEEALDFWISDGNQASRLTDVAPKGKWNRLMNARLLCFELPEDWQKSPSKQPPQKRSRKKHRQVAVAQQITFSGQQIVEARKKLQLSQRALADRIGKSQSWVRDVERGRFQPAPKDQSRLKQVLGMG